MTATVARVSYVKRFKMEMELRDLPAPGALPAGYSWVPWHSDLLDAHADTLHRSFKQEIDAAVFPSFSDLLGCTCLMNEMTRKSSFLPDATWLIAGPEGYAGTVQELAEHGKGAIQNLGIAADVRNRGLGSALLLQALHGFRRHGAGIALLEVTAQNEAAIRLYRRFGFRCRKTLYKAVGVSLTTDMGAFL